MNVLNARVGEIDLAPEKNPDPHVNAFLIEGVTQRVVAEIKVGQQNDQTRTSEERADDIEHPKRGIWRAEGEDVFAWARCGDHAIIP